MHDLIALLVEAIYSEPREGRSMPARIELGPDLFRQFQREQTARPWPAGGKRWDPAAMSSPRILTRIPLSTPNSIISAYFQAVAPRCPRLPVGAAPASAPTAP